MPASRISLPLTMLAVVGLCLCSSPAGARAGAEAGISVDGEIALTALVSLGDGHLQKMADFLHMLADSDAGRSGDWERIRGPLTDLAGRNVPALVWFALPDGSYWSVRDGKEPGNLSERAYWPKLMARENVLGELVVSTATGKPVAIVAVPIEGDEGSLVGVLGASVYLDDLSDTIRQQLGIRDGMIFYSFDETGLVALNWDPELVFFEPRKAGDAALAKAFDEMLANSLGTVRYTFRGKQRTVTYRRSCLSDWWYAFGVVGN